MNPYDDLDRLTVSAMMDMHDLTEDEARVSVMIALAESYDMMSGKIIPISILSNIIDMPIPEVDEYMIAVLTEWSETYGIPTRGDMS